MGYIEMMEKAWEEDWNVFDSKNNVCAMERS